MASSMELQINAFIMKLKRRQLPGTVETAQKTVELLRVVVSSQPRCTTSSLLEAVRDVGKRLVDASSELVVGNMVRRVMNVIREEDQQDSARGRDDQSDFDEDDDDGDGQEETLRDGGPKVSTVSRHRFLSVHGVLAVSPFPLSLKTLMIMTLPVFPLPTRRTRPHRAYQALKLLCRVTPCCAAFEALRTERRTVARAGLKVNASPIAGQPFGVSNSGRRHGSELKCGGFPKAQTQHNRMYERAHIRSREYMQSDC